MHKLNEMKGCLVYLWSIMLACWLTMKATCRRECNRCLIWVHVLGWCWLPCRNNHLYHLCTMSWSSGTQLHKHCTPGISHSTHEHTCIIQARRIKRWDPRNRRKPRAGTSRWTRAGRRAVGVPEPQAEHVWERQAPEHSKSPYSG